MPARSVIIGVGAQSSQFAKKLVSEIVGGRKQHGLVAVGIYDKDAVAGSKVRRDIHRQTRRMHIKDISVDPSPADQSRDPIATDLVELRERVLQLAPQLVLLIIDADLFARPNYAEVFELMRIRRGQLKLAVLLFTNGRAQDDNAYDLLRQYGQDSPLANDRPIVEGSFVVKNASPLASTIGGQSKQSDLLATSLAGIWSAPLYGNYNPSFSDQLDLMRDPDRHPDRHFIGLAISTQGLTMERGDGFLRHLFYPILRHTTWFITVEQAQEHLVTIIEALFRNQPPMTTVRQFDSADLSSAPMTVNLMLPFRRSSQKFRLTRDRVAEELANRGYHILGTSVVNRKGVNLTQSPKFEGRKGKFYGQVCILFGIRRDQI